MTSFLLQNVNFDQDYFLNALKVCIISLCFINTFILYKLSVLALMPQCFAIYPTFGYTWEIEVQSLSRKSQYLSLYEPRYKKTVFFAYA